MAITIGTTSQPVRTPAPALSIRLLLLLYLSIYLSTMCLRSFLVNNFERGIVSGAEEDAVRGVEREDMRFSRLHRFQ